MCNSLVSWVPSEGPKEIKLVNADDKKVLLDNPNVGRGAKFLLFSKEKWEMRRYYFGEIVQGVIIVGIYIPKKGDRSGNSLEVCLWRKTPEGYRCVESGRDDGEVMSVGLADAIWWCLRSTMHSHGLG